MAPRLDLASIEVLGFAECDLEVAAVSAHEWPCPTCGDPQPLDRAWALKVRNLTEPELERAIVVCNDCFTGLGEVTAERISEEPLAVSSHEDPRELLRHALDTDEVEVPFG